MSDEQTAEAPIVPGPGSAPGFWTLANVFTFARFALAPVCAIFYLQETHWGVWVAGWTAGFAMFTDVLDGYYARKSGQTSDLGKIFDPIADSVFFIIVWTALALTGAFPIWLLLPFLAREFTQHVYVRPMAILHGVVLGAVFWGKVKTSLQTFALIAVSFLEVFTDYWPTIAAWTRPTNFVLVAATGLVSVLSILPYFRLLREALKASADSAPASLKDAA